MESKLAPFSNQYITKAESISYKYKCRFSLFSIAIQHILEPQFKPLKRAFIIAILAPSITKVGLFILRPYSPFSSLAIGFSVALPIVNIYIQLKSCLREQAIKMDSVGQEVRNYYEKLSVIDPFMPHYKEITEEYNKIQKL